MNSFILLIIGFVSVRETFAAGWCNPYAPSDCLTASTVPYGYERFLDGKAGPCVVGPNQHTNFSAIYCIVQTDEGIIMLYGGCDYSNSTCAEGSENNITTTTITTTTTTETPFQMPDPILPTELCGNLSEVNVGLTEAQKKELLDIHNLKRSEVAKGNVTGQPAGLDLIELKWDDDLALIAQNHVNNCTFKHDSYPDRETPTYEMVGQNLAIRGLFPTNQPVNVTLQYMLWFNEVYDLTDLDWVDSYPNRTVLNGTVIGHYTQAVWADTEAVGCGLIQYKDASEPGSNTAYYYRHLLACNYGRAGNWLGQPVYTTGTPVNNDGCPPNYPNRNTTTMLCY